MTVYATRLANGADTRDRLRRADAAGFFPSGPGLARGGLRNDGGGAVTVDAGTMTVNVAPFTAWVDGGVSDLQGGYLFVSDASVPLTVAAGHATLTRTDVVIAEVRDTTHDASGSTDARVRILQGTAGGGVPALPTNAVALRNITVPAGLSAGTGGLSPGNLSTDRRTYTTGLGGVLPVSSETERDALPSITGLVVYRGDADRLEVRTSGGWRAVPSEATADGAWQTWTPSISGMAVTVNHARYRRVGKTVTAEAKVTFNGAAPSNPFLVFLPLAARTGSPWGPASVPLGLAQGHSPGENAAQGVCHLGNANLNVIQILSTATTNESWGVSAPWTWAAGDELGFRVEYEID